MKRQSRATPFAALLLAGCTYDGAAPTLQECNVTPLTAQVRVGNLKLSLHDEPTIQSDGSVELTVRVAENARFGIVPAPGVQVRFVPRSPEITASPDVATTDASGLAATTVRSTLPQSELDQYSFVVDVFSDMGIAIVDSPLPVCFRVLRPTGPDAPT
jgi:hypothetical protein